MRNACALVGVVVVLALSCWGCDSGSQSVLDQADKVLGADDFGSTVAVAVGELIDIALQANPTTGYQWRCQWEPQEALELVDAPYIPTQPVMTGSGGVQHFLLRALQPGVVTVTLQYGRWWEGGELEEPQTVTLNVGG